MLSLGYLALHMLTTNVLNTRNSVHYTYISSDISGRVEDMLYVYTVVISRRGLTKRCDIELWDYFGKSPTSNWALQRPACDQFFYLLPDTVMGVRLYRRYIITCITNDIQRLLMCVLDLIRC